MAFLFTYGDYDWYEYVSDDSGIRLRAEAHNKNKTSYAAIPTSFTYNGVSYRLGSLSECFYNCTNMVQAPTIPDTSDLLSIAGCFQNCTSLSITPSIPNRVALRDLSNCFRNCRSLTEPPILPTSGKTIFQGNLSHCFQGCINLTTAPEIPAIYSNLNYTFTGCKSLVTVPAIPARTLPSHHGSYPTMEYTFQDCTSLVNAPAIPNNVDSIKGCFEYCTSLVTAPTISNTVTDMSYCFRGCSSLQNAPTIPNGITTLSHCFQGCGSLQTAPIIPSSVTNMTCCFLNCDLLVGDITVLNKPTAYTNIFSAHTRIIIIRDESGVAEVETTWRAIADNYLNVFYDIPTYEEGDYYYYKTNSYVGVRALDSNKISYTDNILSSVVFDGVTYSVTCMNSCFDGCKNFNQSITIPNSITDIQYCFNNCVSLVTPPIIPNTITSMDYCFYGCTALTTAPVIPNSVTSLYYCFCGCVLLTSMPTIPNNVTDLSYCFCDCEMLVTTSTIPNSVRNMDSCFSGCTSLVSSPIIPNGVINLNCCFYNCFSLEAAPTIPSSVTNLFGCFYGCATLTTAPIIPNTITHIEYCFYECTALTTAPIIPNSVTSLSNCFRGCTSLVLPPTIPNTITSMDYCFYGCTTLTTAPIIPNSVTNLSNCFYECTALTTAPIIPNSVTNITSCFRGCTALTGNIYILAPCSSNYTNVFTNTSKTIKLVSKEGQDTNYTQLAAIANEYSNVSVSNDLCTDGEYLYINNNDTTTGSVNVLDTTKTSYSDISDTYTIYDSTATNNQRTRNITDLSYCFRGCTQLINAPQLSNYATNLYGCFLNCSHLEVVPTIPSSVTNMANCFTRCVSLTIPCQIPNNVTNMTSCFAGCSLLTTAPVIPPSVTNLHGCFGETSLITAPIIPNSVTNLTRCFQGCRELTGTITINSSNLSAYDGIFQWTIKDIILLGTSSFLRQMADTASNGNVYVWSLSTVLSGDRDDDEPTNVEIEVDVTRFRGNNESLQSINVYVDNSISPLPSLTWYRYVIDETIIDAATFENNKMSLFVKDDNNKYHSAANMDYNVAETYYDRETYSTLTNVMNSATKSFYTTLTNVDENATVKYSIIVIDDYGSSNIQYLTVPINFYTIDFLKGGREISFGEKASAKDLYKHIGGISAPTFEANKYYSFNNNTNSFIPLREEPDYWSSTWYDYYEEKYPTGLIKSGMSFLELRMVGEIKLWAGISIPDGWLECDGSAVSRTEYPLLYAAIQDTYGAGDGSSTFNVPDLRGRFAIGAGLGTASDATSRILGHSAGSERVTLTEGQLPSHSHGLYSGYGDIGSPTVTTDALRYQYWGGSNRGWHNQFIDGGTNCRGESHGNMPPYLTIRYIICAV